MSLYWGVHAADSYYVGQQAAAAEGKARKAGSKADNLATQVERLTLTCEAMWTLLRDKVGLSDVDLVERIHSVDLSDGKLDGKVRKGAVSCPDCKRTISRRYPRCMYCGKAVVHDPF